MDQPEAGIPEGLRTPRPEENAGEEAAGDRPRATLLSLAATVREKFANLSVVEAISGADEDFLDVTPISLSSSRLTFLPTFHLIIKDGDGHTFRGELVSFNGKVVSSEPINFDGEGKVDSKFLFKLDSGQVSHCSGLTNRAASKTTSAKLKNILIEQIEDVIFTRSRECDVAILTGDKAICVKCQDLSRKICSAAKPEDNIKDEDVEMSSDKEDDNKGENYDEIGDEKPEPAQEEGEPESEENLTSKLAATGSKTRCEKNLLSLINSGIIKVETASEAEKRSSKKIPERTMALVGEDGGGDFCGISITRALLPPKKNRGQGRPPGTTKDGVPTAVRNKLMRQLKPKIVLKTGVPVNFKKQGKRKIAEPVGKPDPFPDGIPHDVIVRPTRRPPKLVIEDLRRSIVEKEERIPQTCKICLFEHDRPHVFEKHLKKERAKFDLSGPVRCPDCGANFATKEELNPHYHEAHDADKGVCVICGEVHPAKSLRRHLEYAHFVSVKTKLCSDCGRAFRSKGELDVHMAVAHGIGAQNVICDVCGKMLAHPGLLKKHHSTAHVYNNKGKIQCPFCTKVFNKTMSWHKHIKTHSKTKPFRCGFCDYRSVKRYNILLHMRKRHQADASYNDLVVEGEFDFGMSHKNMDPKEYIIE